MYNYYILLGGNIGDREDYLSKAKMSMQDHFIQIVQSSSIYETAAWGQEESEEKQQTYLNQVILITCHYPPQQLLQITQSIELQLDRTREVRWGARTIDIDILYCQDLIIDEEHLTIPHPRIQERRFTLVPLVEIAAQFTHPISGKTQEELLMICPDDLEVKIYKTV